ncbi:unnamed protein product [Phytophthora fragariaefolia]|uniref:Unnamed protein product n=1 Tax=Phytophthora fragariaefolia TaxID=1490495 RepID=A0A9W7D3F9_9STRA|nr:unnamed protein product [Phytophthora fragariaefolia]
MQFVSNLVSEHACELIYDQYIYATTRAKYKYCETVPNMFLLQHEIDEEDALDEPRCEYSVTKRDWSCSCLFMSSRLLPCRHHGDYGAILQATKQPEPVPDYNPTDICEGERLMQDETEELDSSASVDVNEERHEDEGLAGANGNACEVRASSDSSADSTATTQLGTDTQLGTHLGAELVQVGPDHQLGTHLGLRWLQIRPSWVTDL